jgi:hypothetical protein
MEIISGWAEDFIERNPKPFPTQRRTAAPGAQLPLSMRLFRAVMVGGEMRARRRLGDLGGHRKRCFWKELWLLIRVLAEGAKRE